MDNVTHKTALMCKIERLDGTVLGLTNHDRDLRVEDVIYHGKSKLDPSETQKQIGLQSDDMDVLAVIDHDIIRSEDIRMGLFDDAAVEYFLFDWENNKTLHHIFSGVISKIDYSERMFRAEMDWRFSKLNHVFGQSYTEYCSAQFCDQKCGLDEAKFTYQTRIHHSDSNQIWIENMDFRGTLKGGRVEFVSRPEKISRYAIQEQSSEGRLIKLKLWNPVKFKIKEGEKIRLTLGCDKQFSTCKNFKNTQNFRGFPHMPGEEVLRNE